MKCLCIFFVIISLINGFEMPRNKCLTDVQINGQYYNLTSTIHMRNAYPADAHFDSRGNLFFVKSGRRTEGFYFDIFLVKSNTNIADRVEGMPENMSYSIAVDKKKSQVFFGTAKGIYEYDYDTGKARRYSEENLKLNMIFIDNDGNKYVTESNNGVEELYLLDCYKKIRYESMEALDELGIAENNDFYFIRGEKLFVLRTNSSKAVEIFDVAYSSSGQIAFYDSMVFVARRNLIYAHMDRITDKKTVCNLPEATAIAFDDNGNFVVGTQDSLLIYEKNNCYFRLKEN